MSQKLFTQRFGEVVFTRTWADGNMHIGRLEDGGYAHLTGLPVSTRAELEIAIPPGPDLAAALTWFEHRNDPVDEPAAKRLVMQPNGGYVFEDGSPVKTISDLVNHLRPGPALDAAVQWFSDQKRQEAEDAAAGKKAQESPFGKAALKAIGKPAPAVPDEKGEVEITD